MLQGSLRCAHLNFSRLSRAIYSVAYSGGFPATTFSRAELKWNKLLSAVHIYLIFAFNYSTSRNARVEYRERGGNKLSVRADRGRGARALRDIANGICVTCYGLVVYRVSDIYKREKRVLYYSIRSSLCTRAFFSTSMYARRGRGYRDLCVV